MKCGDLIEFPVREGYALGVITRIFGKKKLKVRTAEGEDRRTTRDDVTFHLDEFVGPDASRKAIEHKVQRFRDRAEEVASDLDLEIVWEVARELSGVHDPERLAELYFDDQSQTTVFGVKRRLRQNGVYFKKKKRGYEPRDPDKVEELEHRRKVERQKRQRRQSFVDDLQTLLESEVFEQTLSEHFDDKAFRDHIEQLKRYALYGSGASKSKDTEALLDLIERQTGFAKGEDEYRAFWLLVELGIWHRHENLVLKRFSRSRRFENEIEREKQRILDSDPSFESRKDLTDLSTYSVDDETTRDIDDAVSVERLEDGKLRVSVHIADPGFYVEPGSGLDEAAFDRGASIYLPTDNIPMFPREVTEEVMSLVSERVRPAITTRAVLTEDFEIETTDVVLSAVEVDRGLSYADVNQMFGEDEFEPEWAESFQILRDIGEKLHRKRRRNDAVTVNIPDRDIRVEWDDQNRADVRIEVKNEKSAARQLIGELMILNNRIIGEFCRQNGVPIVYRNQAPPNGDLFSEDIMSYPQGIAREFQRVYRMNPGVLSTEPEHHAGLGITAYAQASSPIRRYTDLVCQRQLKSYLLDRQPPYDGQELTSILGNLKNVLSEVGRVQSDSDRYWTLLYLKQHADEQFEAIVLDHNNRDGTHASVFLTEIALKENCQFRKTVDIGKKMMVEVEDVDPRRDRLYLRGVE